MWTFSDRGVWGKDPHAKAIGDGRTNSNTVHAEGDRRVWFGGTAERRGGIVGGLINIERAGTPGNIVHDMKSPGRQAPSRRR